jgi:hypothetical protein
MANMTREMARHPTGKVDTDVVTIIVPHHETPSTLRYSILKRLAQKIIIDRQQKISAMDLTTAQVRRGSPMPALPQRR